MDNRNWLSTAFSQANLSADIVIAENPAVRDELYTRSYIIAHNLRNVSLGTFQFFSCFDTTSIKSVSSSKC